MEHEVYQLFSEIQATHWWFVARRRIIADVLQRYLTTSKPLRIAEIGCGTGAMLPVLSQFGEAWGIDNSPEAVKLCAQKKFAHVYLDSDSAWRQTQFEGMAFFDVIEHVPEDAAVMKNYLAQLQPGGWVIITVPAFMFLWSEHDVLNQHYRRYHAAQLRRTISTTGLQLERISYFNTWLFPAIALTRLATKTLRAFTGSTNQNGHTNLRTDFDRNLSFLNRPLQTLFASERFALRYFSFPFGTSLLALARKPLGVEPSKEQMPIPHLRESRRAFSSFGSSLKFIASRFNFLHSARSCVGDSAVNSPRTPLEGGIGEAASLLHFTAMACQPHLASASSPTSLIESRA